jgi:hypothetical protein
MPNTYTKKSTGEVVKYDGKQYAKKSYEKNKEKILAKSLFCEHCVCHYTASNVWSHNRSKRHIKIMEYKNQLKTE